MRTLKLKPTKVLAKEILKKANGKFDIEQVKLDTNQFRWYCGDVWDNTQDYDIATGKFTVWRLTYPNDYYACDRYITTKDLKYVCKNILNKTLENFINEFIEQYEI